ncbi:hypothetical protein PF008_g12458 [Phytophthora fragariae]|uniref:Integrase catalytic domain-containing protein n=1 Tax=Phytophthora fragariae TaxID=53985 RepID=A0A6G0RMX2_9STRA|nr:hypothetical protein PF008_g12458 [Phytophthora fragariae]
MNTQALRQAFEANVVDGMDLKACDFEQPLKCIACAVAKAKRMACKRHSGKRPKMPYERLMSDVCYIGLQTPGKTKYFQLIEDEASRFKWVFMLKKKSEAALNVIKLILRLEKKHVILTFSCDQGRVFVNVALTTFLEEHGVRLLTTNAYTPEKNCLVEKLNGVLLSKVSAVQEAAKLPACLWGEVLSYVVYVDNRSITKALCNMTPHEKLLGVKPNVSSVAFYHIPKPKQRNKLEMRAKPAIFLGYAEELIGYRLMDLTTGALIECRSVTWREDLTVDADYLEKLVARRYYGKVVDLPKNLPYVSLPAQQVGDTSVVVDLGESGAQNQVEGAKSQAVADSNDSDVSMADSDGSEVSDDSMNGDTAVPSLDHDDIYRGEDDVVREEQVGAGEILDGAASADATGSAVVGAPAGTSTDSDGAATALRRSSRGRRPSRRYKADT